MTESQSTDSLQTFHPIAHQHPWFNSQWMKTYIIATTCIILLVSISTDVSYWFPVGQLALLISFTFSLAILADKPLVNPIQAFVVIFYWWFGVAPLMISSYNFLFISTDIALSVQLDSIDGVWPVIIGLPIYAICSKLAVNCFEKNRKYLKSLYPQSKLYLNKTILIYLSIGMSPIIVLLIASTYGVSGIREVDYLGGTKTTIWWVGIIAAFSSMSKFVNSALMYSLVLPKNEASHLQKLLAVAVLIQSIFLATFSGWKGVFVFMFLQVAVAFISEKQRIPFKTLLLGMFVFIVLVEPYVKYGRYLSEMSDVTSSREREVVYKRLLTGKDGAGALNLNEINIESPFRGIYSLASNVVQENEYFSGGWDGKTIIWGLEALVPRAFYPDKPDMNIGNFFYHNVNKSSFISYKSDDRTNISITIPYEIIGNYGIIAGILSFGIIGFFWGGICSYVLTPGRLSNHPLTPLFIIMTFSFESAFGHFLAGLRTFIIPVILAYLIWKQRRGVI